MFYEASTAQMLDRIQSSRGLLLSPPTIKLATVDWSTVLQESVDIQKKTEGEEDQEESSERLNSALVWDDLDAIFELEL
jgi:hypothetical protein